MNYIIVDLEATCWEKSKGRKNEIIEIGAVKVNAQNEIVDEFCQIIQPVVHTELSAFCTELTSITQEMVDEGVHFTQALPAFLNWIQETGDTYLVCSWGYYDKNQFISDCRLHQLETGWINHHISLKHQHAHIKGLKRPIGMKGALAMEGFELDGTHHRGIDDARNITKIFQKYFGQWIPEGIKKK